MNNKKRLAQFARNLRNNPTKAENRMWYNNLSRRQFLGYRFIRQKVLGPFIVDFYCPMLKLIIEIDGKSHDYDDGGRDLNREKFLIEKGYHVLRFTDWEIFKQQDEVYRILSEEIEQLEKLTP